MYRRSLSDQILSIQQTDGIAKNRSLNSVHCYVQRYRYPIDNDHDNFYRKNAINNKIYTSVHSAHVGVLFFYYWIISVFYTLNIATCRVLVCAAAVLALDSKRDAKSTQTDPERDKMNSFTFDAFILYYTPYYTYYQSPRSQQTALVWPLTLCDRRHLILTQSSGDEFPFLRRYHGQGII